MKKEDIDNMLRNMEVPDAEKIKHQQELKIPLLRYKQSSKAGLWLLIIPVIVAFTAILKYDLLIDLPFVNTIAYIFSAIDRNKILTYLIPLIFIGFPLITMLINFLAFCHFSYSSERKEILMTIKYRPLNIALFLFSFALIIFFMLPDKLSF